MGNPKSGGGRLRERSRTTSFHYKVQVTVQTGFHKGGRNKRVVAWRASTVFVNSAAGC